MHLQNDDIMKDYS